jgi:hypothetical protein
VILEINNIAKRLFEMNKLYKLFSFFILIFIGTVYSQSDSVLDYMPLQIGNQWQYKVYQIVYGPPQTDTTIYYSFSVVERDTIMPNRYQYQVVRRSDSTTRYIYIDSITACVYEYDYDSSHGFKIDSLRCSQGDWFSNNNYCAFIDTATVLNYNTWTMGIESVSPDITANHTLAMDIGVIYVYLYHTYGWGIELISNLVYAKVNGVEFGEIVNSLSDIKNELTGFNLYQNYPNPFNSKTKIEFRIADLPDGKAGFGFVSLKVYDVLGNEIATLVNEEKPAGNYEVEWDATGLPSGIYFYQLRAGNYIKTKKMLQIK